MQVLNRCGVSNGDASDWKQQIRVELRLITPEIAADFLRSNDGNYRAMRNPHKRKMVADMVSGDWSFTNATIAFDVDGRLVDGQHRLGAIVESETSQWLLVVFGMPSGSQSNPAIDTGARRSVATHLQNKGVGNSNVVAAAARLLYRLKDGRATRAGSTREASDTKVARMIANTPSISDAVAATVSCKKIATPSVMAAWYWIASKENLGLANECVGILSGAIESSTVHPFAKCREVFLQSLANKKALGMKADVQLRYLMSAWEKALTGTTAKLLRPVSVIKIPDSADIELQRLG